MPANLNALSPTGDINTYGEYFKNHSYNIRPEWFYQKQLLDTIRYGSEEFVHYRLAETMPIQNRAAKLQLRRWSALRAHTVPLTEGIPPKSDKGSMEMYELGTHQYGRYMEFTDKVDFNFIDPVIAHYTAQYSIVAVETLDLLARDALHAVPNKYYANMAGGLDAMDVDSGNFKPSLADLRVIVLGMKKRLVKPRGRNYMVIGTPDFTFDLVTDPLVQQYLTINQTTKSVYTDSVIPPLFGMEFYETMHTDNEATFTHVYANGVSTKAIVMLDAADPKVKKVYYATDDTGKDTGFYKEVTDTYTGDGFNFADKELNAIPSMWIWDMAKISADAGFDAKPMLVDKVLIIGAKALIRTEIAGRGNAKMYVKPLGSAGTLDPINQRQSIGFKIDSVGFGVERNEAVAIYNCIPTQLNA